MGGGSSRARARSLFAPPTYDTYGGVQVPYYPWKVSANNLDSWLQPGIGNTFFEYRPATSSGDWDPAVGCDKQLVANYTCGKKNKSVGPYTLGYWNIASFDCGVEHSACMNYRFEVKIDGSVAFTDAGGRDLKTFFTHIPTSVGGINMQTNEGVNSKQPVHLIKELNQMVLYDNLPGRFNLKRKFVRFMSPGDTLGPGEYICSSTGNCFFALDPVDSKFKIFALKIRADEKPLGQAGAAVMEGTNDVGEVKSAAVYSLRGVSILNRDKVANISIDGNRRMFGNENLELGTMYSKIKDNDVEGREVNYDNPGNDLEEIANESGDISYCFDQCTSRRNCGGFVVDTENPTTCFLKDKNIFPSSNRVKDNSKQLYKRLFKPKNVSSSCMKPANMQVVAIDSKLLDHYPVDTRNPKMNSRTLCGVDDLVQPHTSRYKNINSVLDDFRTTISGKINSAIDVIKQYNFIQSDPEMQVTEWVDETGRSNPGLIDRYDEVHKKIKKIISKKEIIDGIEEDTRIQVISETYKYIISGIISVIIIIVIVVYGDISTYTASMGNAFNNFFKSPSLSFSSSASESNTTTSTAQ